VLTVLGLVKRYPHVGGEPVQAITDVGLAVGPGDMVALYGPSGSGKTTLLKIVAAALSPDRGEVIVDGRSVVGLDDRAATAYRLHALGLVLQSFHMIAGLSAIESASLKLIAGGASRRDALRRVTPLLERLGLAARADHRASDLSMGERQRLALAKALSNDPPLVLADEPTGSLDTSRGREVLEFLRERADERGTAVLIATHDPQAAAYATQVIELRDGRLTPRPSPLQGPATDVTGTGRVP
jgi:putative ABC transport system ATP-binding protein